MIALLCLCCPNEGPHHSKAFRAFFTRYFPLGMWGEDVPSPASG